MSAGEGWSRLLQDGGQGRAGGAVQAAEVAGDGLETVAFGPNTPADGGLVLVVAADGL